MLFRSHKSQELVASASGTGGSNQLVFDDSPGQGRIELSSSSAQTRLQLGHLLHQVDNRRLQPRGHGIDLATAAWGAVLCSSVYLVAQIYGVGLVTSMLSGLTFELGVFMALGGILLCSFLGGMHAVTWTQLVQCVVLVVTMLAIAVAVAWKTHGRSEEHTSELQSH